jgi:hypothetical protein
VRAGAEAGRPVRRHVPLVYNGWVQKLPQPWKKQLTENQLNPIK